MLRHLALPILLALLTTTACSESSDPGSGAASPSTGGQAGAGGLGGGGGAAGGGGPGGGGAGGGSGPVACADLATLPLDGAVVTSSEIVAPAGDAPEHCYVAGVIDSTIGFEVKLPVQWSGKLLMFGNGGFAGSIQHDGLDGLALGYATVTTDTGHTGSSIDGSWALGDPQAVINFGHLAVHRTATIGKAVVGAHYAQSISRSYFFGCSRGGGQGLMEAQRYPDDFDGIVSGAPAFDWTGFGMGFIWNQGALYPDPNDLTVPALPAAKLAIIGAAVNQVCDSLDGIVDGVIADPRNCPFDPAQHITACPGDVDGPTCLTSTQLAALQAIYDGPSGTSGSLFPGFPPGAEADPDGWLGWIVGQEDLLGPGIPNGQYAFGQDLFRYLVYDDASYDFRDFDFDSDLGDLAPLAAILNATDPDLSAFRDAGGKLLSYSGWADPALTTLRIIDYFEEVTATMGGAAATAAFYRLFLAPGMLHCGGGPGPNLADFMTPLVAWVEQGVAPDQLVAYHLTDGQVDDARPLCPYPQQAAYTGPGDANDPANWTAANFTCQ